MHKFVRAIVISIILLLGLTACGTADPAPDVLVQPEIETEVASPEEPANSLEASPKASPEAVTATEQSTPQPNIPEGATVFSLVEGQSEARFIIGEILRGEPKTVIGNTAAVSGMIFINPEDLAATQVGVITVLADTLRTDNNFRNGAIRDFILQTGKYPEITFTPISIEALPEQVAVGESFSFDLAGDLKIREITRRVVFRVTVTAESEEQIRGFASATILRQDFDLNIPSVPQVAGVDPQVILELDFLATQ